MDRNIVCTGGHALRIAIGITMLVLVLVGGTGAAPLEEWNRTFGGMDNDSIRWVQQTSNGFFILTGVTESYGKGSSDAWLIRTNATGFEI